MTEASPNPFRASAGVCRRAPGATIRAEGADRVRFLNGMLTNDVSKLEPGRGQWSVKASSKGKVEGLARVRCGAEDLLLDLVESSAGRVAEQLVRHVVMDDVRLSDGGEGRQMASIHGPDAPSLVSKLIEGPLPELEASFVEADGLVVIRDDRFGVPGFELHHPPARDVVAELVAAGATETSEDALEVLRVEAGLPKDGVDLDLDTIPLEARLDYAIDLKKGCYIGQETIARATHRGGVKHHLVGLRFPSGARPVGAELWNATKKVGEVTSAVVSETAGATIGLGYVHITAEAPGTALEARTGEESAPAEVVSLPHVAVHAEL